MDKLPHSVVHQLSHGPILALEVINIFFVLSFFLRNHATFLGNVSMYYGQVDCKRMSHEGGGSEAYSNEGMRKHDSLYGCMCRILVVFDEMDDVDLMK